MIAMSALPQNSIPTKTRTGAAGLSIMIAFAVFAASVALGSSYASAQFSLPKPKTKPATIVPGTPPEDNGKCNVDDKAKNIWIAQSKDLLALEAAFKSAYVALGSAPATMFGYNANDAGRTQIIQTARDKAQQALKDQGDELYKWAQKYAGYQLKSCDECILFNKWGNIATVSISTGSIDGSLIKPATTTSAAITLNLKGLTRGQVEDDEVQEHAEAYVRNVNVLSLAPPAPPFTSPTATADLEKCEKSFDKTTGKLDPSKCNKAHIQSYLDIWRDALVDSLTTASTKPSQGDLVANIWKNRKTALECKPDSSFTQLPTIQYIAPRIIP